jgi:hypothetical protein
VQEHHPLTLRILHTVIQKAQDDAYVEANSRRYPAGGRDHRRTVRATAETSAPRPKVSIRFLPSYDDQCSAVFAGSVESATRLAYRRFATSIPAGNQALEVPTIAPDLELGRDQLGFESISDIESFLSEPSAQNLIPKTESYHAAMAPTESATSLATEPYTPVSAILDSPGVLAGAAGSTAVLRMGSALTIGRAPGNDLVATDDLSVSGTHLRVTLRVGCVEIEASGKTGTWVTTHRGQQHIRAGGVESIPLPATITLGDARKTILRISETRIPAE